MSRSGKSYVGLKGAEAKLRRYLRDFEWGDLEQASAAVEWSRAPIITLSPSLKPYKPFSSTH
ncbi:MAG: hypothetical protein LIP09_16000 [Bacteroidales bacterium]|nr:hypothetical protein [Bacteroidales bacterium]